MGRKKHNNPPRFIQMRVTEKSLEYLSVDCMDKIHKSKPLHEILHRVLLEHAKIPEYKFIIEDLKSSNQTHRLEKERLLNHIKRLESEIFNMKNNNEKEILINK